MVLKCDVYETGWRFQGVAVTRVPDLPRVEAIACGNGTVSPRDVDFNLFSFYSDPLPI